MAARVFAALVAAVAFAGSLGYVVGHPKNAAAPLQPPAASPLSQATAAPSAAPSVARATARPGASTAPPRITVPPGVRATELPGITYTHVS